jgi:hypothetical protein
MRWRWWFRELAGKRKTREKEGRRQPKERKGLGFGCSNWRGKEEGKVEEQVG